MRIARVWSPDQLAPFRQELTAAFRDFLHRAEEPFTPDQFWAAVPVILSNRYAAVWLILDDEVKIAGFCVAVLTTDNLAGVPAANIWILYLSPRKVRLRELLKDGWPILEKWAKGLGAQSFTVLTRRTEKAYPRLLARLGFTQESVLYRRRVSVSQESQPAFLVGQFVP